MGNETGAPGSGSVGRRARNWGACALFSLLTPRGPLSPPSSSLAYRLAGIILKLCCLNQGLLSSVHPNKLGSCHRGEEWSDESLESWLHLSRRLLSLVFFIFFFLVFAFCFPQIVLGHARSLQRIPSPHLGGEDAGSLWGGCLESLGRVPGRLVNPGVQLEGALWHMFPLILVLLLPLPSCLTSSRSYLFLRFTARP